MFESCRAHSAVTAAALGSLAAAAGAPAQDPGPPEYYPVRVGTSGVAFVEWSNFRSRLLRFPGFTDITPPGLTGSLADVDFIDARVGWITENDCARGRGGVYRTSDGGRRWRRVTTRFSVGCAAGSRLDADFVDRRHGWLLTVQPTGPGSHLYLTRDGGRTWRAVTARRGEVRQVAFTSRTTGWGAWAPPPGAPARLFRTDDGGLSWTHVRQLPRGRYQVPVFHGRRGVVATTVGSDVLVYRSDDRGRSWRFVTRLRFGAPLHEPAVSSPAPGVWWIEASSRRQRFLAVTADGGRSWVRSELEVPRELGFALVATSARRAWESRGGRLYATRDAGRTWTRVQPR